MAANLERLAKEWQNKYPQIANGLNDLARTARGLGAPESFSVANTVEVKAVQALSRDQLILFPKPRFPRKFQIFSKELKKQELAYLKRIIFLALT